MLMTTNGSITIWHRGWDGARGVDTYSHAIYAAHWYQHMLTSVQTGLAYANEVKVRIPGTMALDIAVGDRIIRGEVNTSSPPNIASTIIGYSDNRRGLNPHWLVMAK